MGAKQSHCVPALHNKGLTRMNLNFWFRSDDPFAWKEDRITMGLSEGKGTDNIFPHVSEKGSRGKNMVHIQCYHFLS